MENAFREPLLGVIREQGECLFRHKGAGSKDRKSQGGREHGNSNQGADFLSVKREQGANREQICISKEVYFYNLIGADTRPNGLFPYHLDREHAPKNLRASEKITILGRTSYFHLKNNHIRWEKKMRKPTEVQ